MDWSADGRIAPGSLRVQIKSAYIITLNALLISHGLRTLRIIAMGKMIAEQHSRAHIIWCSQIACPNDPVSRSIVGWLGSYADRESMPCLEKRRLCMGQ